MDDKAYFSKYDKLISEALAKYHVPGTSIAVVHGDKTWTKAYGLAQYPGEEVKVDTLFNAASMSKAFVSATVSLLVDDATLPDVQWTTPVSHIIPDDFVLSDPRYTEMVSLEDILSHRSGLADQDDACFGIHASIPDTPKSCTRKLRYLPLSAPVRTKFQYCNLMYVVAVHLVETLSGQSMSSFLRERMWKPLGMENSFFGNDDAAERGSISRLAKGYGWNEDTETPFEIPWPVQPEAAGAGEILSTASDYARFLRCMIRKEGPMSAAGHEELVRPRTILTQQTTPFMSTGLYALGWMVENYHGETVLSHGGGTNGFRCQMWFFPRLEWGVVIFTNSESGSYANDKICFALMDDMLGVPQEKRKDWDKVAAEDMAEPEETIADLFPEIPSPIAPLSVSLPSYTGIYTHPGYGDLVVQERDGVLMSDATDRTWRPMLTFKHVYADFFAVELQNIDTREKTLLKGEFRPDAAGVVEQLGIALVEELDGEMIWFHRNRCSTSPFERLF